MAKSSSITRSGSQATNKSATKRKVNKQKTTSTKIKKKTKAKNKKTVNRRKERKITPCEELLFTTRQFLSDIDCVREMFYTVEPLLLQQDVDRTNELQKIIELLKSQIERKHPDQSIENANEMRRLGGIAQRIARAYIMFRRQSIVLLVSRLDEFTASILKIVYRAFPDRLKDHNKPLHFNEFIDAKSLGEIQDRFIESKIDALLRQSHLEQIEYIDKQFKIGLEQDFSLLPDFIEIAQRRHLFVHTGGVINRHYIDLCDKAKYKSNDKKSIGEELHVSEEYFKKAVKIIYELGLLIGQGMSRRLYKDNLRLMDTHLIEWGFNLLLEERWDLASIIFDFGLNLPDKFISDENSKRRYLINRAIAYKWTDQKEKMSELLESVDWSASSNRFLLIREVLYDRFDSAEQLMGRIGEGEIKEEDFQIWPSFRVFRGTKEFERGYKKIFHKTFTLQIPPKTI